MKRSLFVLLSVAALMLALVGCGGSEEATKADTPKETPEKVVIADDRIVGEWEGEDGDVEFKDNGTVVLDDGTELPFAMPSSEQLKITFPAGVGEYAVTWEGDDRHGVVSKDSTDTTPTWYDRKK